MAEFTFRLDWEKYDGMMAWENDRTLDRYMELTEGRNKVDLKQFDCFVAFSREQFEEGKKRIRPLNDGEKLLHLGGGVYATKDGYKRLAAYYESVREQIKAECDPQEVYCFEWNNHESIINYDGDKEAIRIVLDYWGEDVARRIVRKCALYSIDQIIAEED